MWWILLLSVSHPPKWNCPLNHPTITKVDWREVGPLPFPHRAYAGDAVFICLIWWIPRRRDLSLGMWMVESASMVVIVLSLRWSSCRLGKVILLIPEMMAVVLLESTLSNKYISKVVWLPKLSFPSPSPNFPSCSSVRRLNLKLALLIRTSSSFSFIFNKNSILYYTCIIHDALLCFITLPHFLCFIHYQNNVLFHFLFSQWMNKNAICSKIS